MVNELFVSIGMDKQEWVEDIKREECPLASWKEVEFKRY